MEEQYLQGSRLIAGNLPAPSVLGAALVGGTYQQGKPIIKTVLLSGTRTLRAFFLHSGYSFGKDRECLLHSVQGKEQ